MKKSSYNYFDNFSLRGKFWFSDSDRDSFAGILKYSPEHGCQLEYSIFNMKCPKHTKMLYGIVEGGKACTLLGDFHFRSGMNMGSGGTEKFGTTGVGIVIFGGWLEEGTKFENYIFRFNDLEDFLFRGIDLPGTGPQNTNLGYSADINANLCLFSNEIFRPISSASMENVLKSSSERNSRRLGSYLASVASQHSQTVDIREDIQFFIKLQFDYSKSIEDALRIIRHISLLFSMILNKPVFCDNISAFNDKKDRCYLVVSRPSANGVIKRAGISKIHENQPINASKEDIGSLIMEWLNKRQKYDMFAYAYQTEDNHRTEKAIYSDIVIYATYIEDINKELEGKSSDRFKNPVLYLLQNDVKDDVLSKVNAHFKLDIGELISKVRNEICHFNKPKQILNKYDLGDILWLAEVMRLVIVSYVLKELGCSKESIAEYQNNNLVDVI